MVKEKKRVTWLCRVTQKQTALPSYTSWVRQSRRAVRCAAEPRNEFPETIVVWQNREIPESKITEGIKSGGVRRECC